MIEIHVCEQIGCDWLSFKRFWLLFLSDVWSSFPLLQDFWSLNVKAQLEFQWTTQGCYLGVEFKVNGSQLQRPCLSPYVWTGVRLIGVNAVLLFVCCGLSFARSPLRIGGESCGSGPRPPRLKFLPDPHSSILFYIYIQLWSKVFAGRLDGILNAVAV